MAKIQCPDLSWLVQHPVRSPFDPRRRRPQRAHSPGFLTPAGWRRRPILGCFLHFLQKVSEGRFRRQHHCVVVGSSPFRGTRIEAGQEAKDRPWQFQIECCNHHCCRKFESDANHQPVCRFSDIRRRRQERAYSSAFLALRLYPGAKKLMPEPEFGQSSRGQICRPRR